MEENGCQPVVCKSLLQPRHMASIIRSACRRCWVIWPPPATSAADSPPCAMIAPPPRLPSHPHGTLFKAAPKANLTVDGSEDAQWGRDRSHACGGSALGASTIPDSMAATQDPYSAVQGARLLAPLSFCPSWGSDHPCPGSNCNTSRAPAPQLYGTANPV